MYAIAYVISGVKGVTHDECCFFMRNVDIIRRGWKTDGSEVKWTLNYIKNCSSIYVSP